MSIVDPQMVTTIVRDVVDSEILPRFQRLETTDIYQKSVPGDLVTEADLKAEAALSARLQDLLPGSKVIGEEAVFAHEGGLESLVGSDPVWVIDPVDGTGNFVRGEERFACVVALVVDGETVMGWIDSCVERQTACVVFGQGVSLADGQRVTYNRPPGAAVTPVGLETLRGQAGGKSLRSALRRKVAGVDWVGSAAQTYLDLLRGCIDFAAFTRLNVWDHAAGVLMVQEAGGVGRLANGEEYRPILRAHPSPLIVARSESVWLALSNALHSP